MKRSGVIERIRKAHRAQPFVPFSLRLIIEVHLTDLVFKKAPRKRRRA
jgi:hypothetical protein